MRIHQIELEMQNEELRKTQEKLIESQGKYIDLYDFAPVGYLTVSEKGCILEANLTFAGMMGVERNLLLKKLLSAYIYPPDQDVYYLCRRTLLESKKPQTCATRMLKKDGTTFQAQLRFSIHPEVDGSAGQSRAILTDISEQKKIEDEKEMLHRELQTAFKEIKTLHGIIPICAYCKKIRDDKGAWDIVEAYISKNTDAQFSHGVCPDCGIRLMKEIEGGD